MTFNETGTSSLTISGVKFDSTGLGLSRKSAGRASRITTTSTPRGIRIDPRSPRCALSSRPNFGSQLSTSADLSELHDEFLVNVLQTGSDNLVLADTNEEGANLLALQTRQSLSTKSALSLANQSSQAVLKLLGVRRFWYRPTAKAAGRKPRRFSFGERQIGEWRNGPLSPALTGIRNTGSAFARIRTWP